ncbi:hypothetical protein NDR87_24530 [Nocardia sp. CDC159]|uniref:Uncharacterized protein n=1 Tax=Nocardia pulmonis TaxID=2951408 RepID=A0A9X2E790_9NOCA|nr:MULTISPECIES: hypothetical protein [Nocardia]MCM6775069.1 hypothetical protein [Nocardia pulmonis]MCM6789539.1 hypothetical protein [Nocardia sp. CDC159]
MTDADFASFGEPNRSRPEGYRLTHPVNDSGPASTSALTGYDSPTGRTSPIHDSGVHWTQPDVGSPWATGATPTTTPRAETPTARAESMGSPPDSVAIRPDSRTSTESAPLRPETQSPTENAHRAEETNHRSAAELARLLEENGYRPPTEPARRIPAEPAPRPDTSSGHRASDPTPPRRTTVESAPRPETPTARRAADPTPTRRSAHRHTTPLDDAPTTVDIHLVMRLLLASHNLETVAKKAESGDASVEDFVQAARRTRTTAVDLVSAWFGGATQMREFAEALLAATEPS